MQYTYQILTRMILLIGFSSLASCTYIRVEPVKNAALLQQTKTVYVVRHPDSTRDMDRHICESLLGRGIQATSGPLAEKPADTKLYVEYVDRWYWDIVMYLRKLDIYFRDGETGTTVAKASFRHVPLLHSFPSPERKADQMVKRIYKAAGSKAP